VMGKARADSTDIALSRLFTNVKRIRVQHLRFLLGNGNSDHNEQGSRNANEWVNSGQTA
jgi:hypothetical protein